MSFLSSQDKNPDYLNFYLKYIRYISLYAETTVNEIYNDIRIFFRYLIMTKNEDAYKDFTIEMFKEIPIKDVTISMLEEVKPYMINEYLYFLRCTFNNSAKTRNRKLSSIKNFFKYMEKTNLLSFNPTIHIEFAKEGKRLPKYLTLLESKQLLSKTINTSSRNTIRDYAIECIFLNCCLRLSELVGINLTDIKFNEQTLKITGKGNKQRIIYLNDATSESIQEYLKVRPTLPKTNKDYNALFLSERKKRISRRNVQIITEKCLKKAFNDSKDKIHTHSLRHTGATLMHNENNANILIIQKILGHEQLSSTKIYTHVTNQKMKEIMNNCTISSILEKREASSNEEK